MKRVFISFAMEDRKFRDLMVGQKRNEHTPFDFIDMSVKEPWDFAWKSNCRTKIKGCHGVIALVSANTLNAEGARWEIKCAKEEGIPVLGIFVTDAARWAQLPSEFSGVRVEPWSWPTIARFIDGL